MKRMFFDLISRTPRPPENDIKQNAEKVADVGAQRLFLPGFQVRPLGCHNFFEGDGHVAVVRRDEPRFEQHPELLHLFRVQAEVLRAQRPHPDQFEIAPQEVPDHGDFVQPQTAHDAAPAGDPHIGPELSAILEVIPPIDIILKVFRIRVHRPEFVDGHGPAMLPDPPEPHRRAVGRILVEIRLFDLACGVVDQPVLLAVIRHFKTAGNEPAEHFREGDHPFFPFGDDPVEPPRPAPFGQKTFENKVDDVEGDADDGRILPRQPVPELGIGLHAAGVRASCDQGPVDGLKMLVQIAGVVDFAEAGDG